MAVRGTPVPRREDHALLTNGGLFVADRRFDGAAYVTYVTSPVAHGVVRSIDVADTRRAAGVIDVVTAADLGDLKPYPPAAPALDPTMVRPMLATDRVRFVGEPVVAIIAESATAGADAADTVVLDIDPLPALVDPTEALTSAIKLFDNAASNICVHLETEDLSADFDGCEVVVTGRVVNNRVAPCPLETRVAACEWIDGRLTHYSAGQGVHPVRDIIASYYGLEHGELRVVAADVGGSFGAKARPHPEELLLPWLSKRVGRPLVWVPSRSADMNGLVHGRGQVQHVKIGGGRDGRIAAYSVYVVQEAGAYPGGGAMLAGNTKVMLTGCYDIASASFSSDSVVTNTVPTGAYRGAGRPEAAAAIERAVDLFAAEIDMDPAEVRRRNMYAPDRFPLTTLTGTPYDSGAYEAALDLALEASGYTALRAEQAARRARGDVVQMGIGLATYVERTAGILRPEYGSVELLANGKLRALTGSSPYGQGHHTAWAMLISDRTGVAMEDIEIVHGDTDIIPRGGITGGSRSVQANGTAMWQAAGLLVEQARALAADLLEANPDDIVLDPAQGAFHVQGTPAKSVNWANLATEGSTRAEVGVGADEERAGPRIMHAETDFSAQGPTFPFGAHVAVVDVDTELGQVRLRRLIAVDDAGIILNPMLADGQVHGGLAQGAAQALIEEVVYDPDGNPLTSNFADYSVISAAELPSFERVQMETPTHINELGAKGIGESGTVGATPAVQNAVVDALSHLGIRHIDMPLTAQRVWSAINAATAAVTSAATAMP